MVNPATAAAIGLGFSAVGWLISPVLSRFLNQCFDELDIDVPPGFQSKRQILLAKLEKLETTLLPQLLILTDAAEQSPYRPDLEKWIQKLKSAFYEAEHVLGLVEYERLETKVNSLFPSFNSNNLLEQVKEKIQKLNKQQDNKLIEDLKNVEKNIEESLPKRSSDRKYLIKSIEKLEEIVAQGIEFVGLIALPRSGVDNLSRRSNEQHSETISTPVSTVIGRDQDRDCIVKLLRATISNNEKCYSVIGIWGMGGSGKTTLAQYVCEFERKKIAENNDKHFDLVIWAHVSQQFSVPAVLKKIWESAFKEACPTFSSLEGLQFKLGEKLQDQKFFLVLDDVWCDKGVSEEELEQLFAPMTTGKRGSKILVTTRIEEAARALGVTNPIQLRELDEDQFFSLFMSNALGNAQILDKRQNELMSIGQKIAEKLHRSPLAAKTVAGQLRRKLDPEFWSSMLNRSLLNDTMGALFLSYQHLPFPLQRCFALCSLFPTGHEFVHDHLVNMWIAEGFIQTDDSNEHMRDIATRYILELVSCSFFQVDKRAGDLYSMHDLMHDLAEYVSQSEYFKIQSGEEKKIPTQTRHLYIVGDKLVEYMEKICKLKDLCTIVVSRSKSDPLKEVDVDALFTNLRKLRVVKLAKIKSLPKSVIHLKNLRYLKIDAVDAISDPVLESLNRLYQLRVLYIRHNFFLNTIKIPEVGRLILLQDLRAFHVKKKRGLELKQLENLADLSGSLSIYGLHNVERKEEAHEAKLSEKISLQNLHFFWYKFKDAARGNYLDIFERNVVPRDLDVEVLEGLCPPPQIKELVIAGYSGKRLPSWILETNGNIMVHLKSLRLADCFFLEALPRIDKLFDLLSLTISLLPRLKSWVPPPLNLTRLKISHCFSLAFATKEDLEMITSVKSLEISQIVTFMDNSKIHYNCTSVRRVHEILKLVDHRDEQSLSTTSNDFKGCLEKLIDLISQLKLEDIYDKLYFPPALEVLWIESCFVTDRVLAESLQGPINCLTCLDLVDIITITCITDEVLSSLTTLKNLWIRECLLLTSIGGWDTHNNLEQLHVSCCPKLTLKASVVANSCNIVEQTSSSCKSKTTSCILNRVSFGTCRPLDDCFQNLVSLKTLRVYDCPTIVNTHIGNLKSLTDLSLQNCPSLISLRGLSELDHLKELKISDCQKLKCYSDADKLPRLKILHLDRFCQVKQLISRDGFSSLVSLELGHAKEEYFSQQECEVLCCLSSLETIHFHTCRMRMLPNLLGLRALRSVDIKNCKNLTSLSELPLSIRRISINYCNENFTKSCGDPKNPNWQKILHIPEKDIQP